jgi:hypothetical protein
VIISFGYSVPKMGIKKGNFEVEWFGGQNLDNTLEAVENTCNHDEALRPVLIFKVFD